MYEVLKRDKDLADKIVQSYSDMMFAGVVAGNNCGRVWVDSLENPSSAMVWSEGLGGFQFMGCDSGRFFGKELKAFIETTIFSFLKEKGLDSMECSADMEEWYPMLYNVLSDKEIKEYCQYVYKSAGNFAGTDTAIVPKPYRLFPIDNSLMISVKNEKMVSNPEFLIEYIEQFWGSVENCLNLGYGYAAIDDGKMVSFAITSFLYDKTFTLGVETLEQHRRKGLASALTNALVKELQSKGCHIWWDCMDSNIASQKTALSAGLALDHKYKVCQFDF